MKNFNKAMAVCAESGRWDRVLAVLDDMRAVDVSPDVSSFTTAISACEKAGQYEQVMLLLERMTVSGALQEQPKEPKDDVKEKPMTALDNILYINMANRPDRRERLEEQLAQHGLSATRFEAVEGKNVDSSVIDDRWRPGLNAKFDKRQQADALHILSPGERGCAGSHAALWLQCVSENRPMIIIEDDAVLAEDFSDKCQQAMAHIAEHDPSFLYLQSKPAQLGDYYKEITSSLAVLDVKYSWETGGYIVWPETAAILLQNLPMHEPVDNFLARMAYDNHIHQYICFPPIIKQYDQYTDTDILHTGSGTWSLID